MHDSMTQQQSHLIAVLLNGIGHHTKPSLRCTLISLHRLYFQAEITRLSTVFHPLSQWPGTTELTDIMLCHKFLMDWSMLFFWVGQCEILTVLNCVVRDDFDHCGSSPSHIPWWGSCMGNGAYSVLLLTLDPLSFLLLKLYYFLSMNECGPAHETTTTAEWRTLTAGDEDTLRSSNSIRKITDKPKLVKEVVFYGQNQGYYTTSTII